MADNLYQFDEEYRNSLATVDESGKRIWVHPKKPKGKYHNRRMIVTIVLLTIFFTGPFIRIQGHPLLLLNFFERKFIIFGQVFWPQDFFLLALSLILFFVFIILFTVAFGRLWCGWACPQTLFMEMVFRKIEYWIDGDANQQRKLRNSPWTQQKVLKRLAKHSIFLVITLLISHTAMAYLIGIEEVQKIVSAPPTEHIAGFLGLIAFSGIFYWVFTYFREQACTVVCPYGRLQGVLLGKDSIVVAYDWLRGEPRGKLKRDEIASDKGDCIDCKLCVHVCPTQIDIRNGTQLECVNCTACIDACDEVMEKVNRPKGLIRFASHNGIETGAKKIFTPRVASYSVVLIVLLSILGFFIANRSDIETTMLRVPGTLYQKAEDGSITNLYNIQLVNKTFEEIDIRLQVENFPEAVIKNAQHGGIQVPSEELYDGIFINIHPSNCNQKRHQYPAYRSVQWSGKN